MRSEFKCIDGHTCGNPVRLVVEGGPALEGRSMREKRQHFLDEFDWIRKGLMFEPRGHDMMSGSILYPPEDTTNDTGVLFIETSGCLPMCGHGTIGTITMAIENNLIRPKKEGEVRLETPAGLVVATYTTKGKKVNSVAFKNVPAYLDCDNLHVVSPDLGDLYVDVAYGGNFYAIVDQQDNFYDLDEFTASELIAMSGPLRSEINKAKSFVHPEDATIRGCSHILWTGKPKLPGSSARNAVFYADKAIDRSPCGTGTCARMAQWVVKGRLRLGDVFIHESIIGSRFKGKVEERAKINGIDGIIPSIEGWARTTGYNTIIIDDEDPYAEGFQIL